MAKKLEDDINAFCKNRKYVTGVIQWRAECPYCHKVVLVWQIPGQEDFVENNCKHWRSLAPAKHTMKFERVKEVRRKKLDNHIKKTAKPEKRLI